MKQNKKYKKEIKINIKDYFKEINDKRELIKDFKNKYINTKKYIINKNKCELVTLKINSLNKLLNEFERFISISLDIISSFQNNMTKKEIVKIKITKVNDNNELKENKVNNFRKINESSKEKNIYNNNYFHFLNNKNIGQSLNSELIKKNKRLLFNKSYTAEINKNNSSHNNNNINININNEQKVSTHNNNNNSNSNNNFNMSLQTDCNSYSNNLSIISPVNNIRNNNATNSNSQNVIKYSNYMKFPQNYIRNNNPTLKERTLTTLYSPEYSKYFSMQKSQNIIDINNNKNLLFSPVDMINHNYNCNNATFEKKDNTYNQKTLEIKTKNPLKKALRTLIHKNKLSQRSYDYSNKTNKDDILNKIKESEKCKKYFSEKYGDGSYFTFLNKYKIGKLDRIQIKNELTIISNIFENENNLNKYQKRNSAFNKSNLDDSRNILSDSRVQIGIRKRYFFKKLNTDSNRNKSTKSESININDKFHKKIKYSKIEELIKSFEEKIK